MEQWIKNYLTDALGQVIYAGVGSLTSLESLLPLQFESLVLLEPIKSVADKVAKKYAAENLTIKNTTLNVESGLADFTLMQPAKYSSLKTDIQLSSVLKNSKVKSINSIETVSISDLVNQVSLDTQKHNVLILAINGSESACLESTTLNQLTQFSTLCVQIDNKGIYQQDLTYVAELKTQLREKGFYFAEALQENAIFTNLVFKKDNFYLALLEKNQGLEAESRKLKVESEKLKAERDEEKAQVANKTKQLDELKKATEAKESELASRISNLESQVANKTKQLDELAKATEAKESELASRISNLESQVVNKTKQLDELAKATEAKESELASRISNLESQVANKTKQLDELTKATEAKESELASRISPLESNTSQLESENQELTRSARLNQKMLAKSQIDLDHLREKYAEKTKSEAELVELITELREKLTVASQYYYQLQQEHPELLNHANADHE